MFYAIVAWHGLGEFKNETFTQVLTADTEVAARVKGHVWAHSHLSHDVDVRVVVSAALNA